jgi:hypothetical protein
MGVRQVDKRAQEATQEIQKARSEQEMIDDSVAELHNAMRDPEEQPGVAEEHSAIASPRDLVSNLLEERLAQMQMESMPDVSLDAPLPERQQQQQHSLNSLFNQLL